MGADCIKILNIYKDNTGGVIIMAFKITYGDDSRRNLIKSDEYIEESQLEEYVVKLKGYMEILTEHVDKLYGRTQRAGGGGISNSEYKDITYDIINYGILIKDIGVVMDYYKLFSPFDYMRE